MAINKKGFELTISTLVIIILAVLFLIIIVAIMTGGFGKAWATIKGFLTSDVDSTRKACEAACMTESRHDFCCTQRDVTFTQVKEKVNCTDSRLKVACNINCEEEC